jgi:hypothetical protein
MPNLLGSVFEGLSHFARSFCDPSLLFSIQPMVSCMFPVFYFFFPMLNFHFAVLIRVLLKMFDGGDESRVISLHDAVDFETADMCLCLAPTVLAPHICGCC